MINDQKGSKGGAMSQPMDPTKSGEDFLGDTTGLTGVTTGSARQTSSTPNDQLKDENKNHLPGGITDIKTTDTTHNSLSPELTNETEYAKNTRKGMSDEMLADAKDTATEEDQDDQTTRVNTHTNESAYLVNVKDAAGDDSPGSEEINTRQASYSQDDSLGEQSISGSTPDPTSDDDTLEAAHAVGTQLDEDEENPQDLDIARDIDKAEKALRES
jgi:hypothetical protein